MKSAGSTSGRPWQGRLGVPAVALAAAALLAPGCGAAPAGSASATRNGAGPAASGKYAAALAYSRCMRSHGVPGFPDPRQVGGEIQLSGSGTGIDPQSPLVAAARQSCRHLLHGGGEPTPAERQQALARMLQSSRCMRAHGIAGFPDPALSAPAGRAGYSVVMSNGVAWLAVPDSIDVHSPAFERAAAACNLGLS
jgi:hypothetical protein